MTTNPLELIRAEAIPLTWDDISTKATATTAPASDAGATPTPRSRRFINIPGKDDPNKKKVKCFTGSPSLEWIRWGAARVQSVGLSYGAIHPAGIPQRLGS